MRLSLENKNFLQKTENKFKGRKIHEDNLYLENKIKSTKSIYHVDKYEKDFKKSREIKKLRINSFNSNIIIRSKTPLNLLPKINKDNQIIKIQQEGKMHTTKQMIKIDYDKNNIKEILQSNNHNHIKSDSNHQKNKSNASNIPNRKMELISFDQTSHIKNKSNEAENNIFPKQYNNININKDCYDSNRRKSAKINNFRLSIDNYTNNKNLSSGMQKYKKSQTYNNLFSVNIKKKLKEELNFLNERPIEVRTNIDKNDNPCTAYRKSIKSSNDIFSLTSVKTNNKNKNIIDKYDRSDSLKELIIKTSDLSKLNKFYILI